MQPVQTFNLVCETFSNYIIYIYFYIYIIFKLLPFPCNNHLSAIDGVGNDNGILSF